MEPLLIYDIAKKCCDKHNHQNLYVCLNEHFKKEIGNDKEKLLGLKMHCQEKADPEGINLGVSGCALIMTICAIVLNFCSTTILTVIVLSLMMGAYIIWLAKTLIHGNEKRKKYNKILFVLNEIEKEMDNK